MMQAEEGEEENRCNERKKKIRWTRINKYKIIKKRREIIKDRIENGK
jgi:hypothetical protein